jgi:hypothetical protein
MRAKREGLLDDALAALASALRGARVPWMVIGGIAVITRGVRRLTTDVDVVVRGDASNVASLLVMLERHDIRPRIDDAVAFARENLVLLLRHLPSGVDIDLSFGWTAFEAEAIATSTRATYGVTSLPMASVEDLVIYKAIAGRPRDVEDALALMLMHPDIDRARVRRRLVELAELANEPEIVERLERLTAHVRAVRSGALTRLSAPGPSKPARRRPRARRTK